MEKDELKPVRCGCGGEAKVDWTVINGAYMAGVVCRKCGIKTAPVWNRFDKDDAIAEAITAWNTAMSGSAEEKLKAFWDGMSAEMKEERTAKVVRKSTSYIAVPPKDTTNYVQPMVSLWDECGNCGMMGMYIGWKYCPSCGARLEWE